MSLPATGPWTLSPSRCRCSALPVANHPHPKEVSISEVRFTDAVDILGRPASPRRGSPLGAAAVQPACRAGSAAGTTPRPGTQGQYQHPIPPRRPRIVKITDNEERPRELRLACVGGAEGGEERLD